MLSLLSEETMVKEKHRECVPQKIASVDCQAALQIWCAKLEGKIWSI